MDTHSKTIVRKPESYEKFKRKLFYRLVACKFPEDEWVKCNTDDARKDNSGISSYGFCTRDSKGDILYAEVGNIGLAINIVVEATAIWKVIQFGRANNLLK